MTRKAAILLLVGFTLLLQDFRAQTIQLGSGTGEQWEYSSGPVNIYYRRTVCQFVYTAAELTAEGASTINPITEMGFYVTGAPIYALRQYTIKIKHTTQTDVSTALGTTGWTTVKGPFNYSPTAGGWDMIPLDDQTFVWDGVSSIGVEVCWSRVNPTWNASGQVRIYTTTNGYRYSWSDANGSSCGTTPATTSSNKPQMRIVFVPGTSTTWNGSVSTDWFNESNWSAGVPSEIMSAIIPAAPVNQPQIVGQATTDSITVDAGASLTFVDSDTLNIYGTWTMNGTFAKASSTVIFRGTGGSPNLMDGVNNQDFHNIEIRSDAGMTLNTGTYLVGGSLRLRGGTFTSNNRVTLTSSVSGTGSLTEIENLCSYELDMSDSYGDGWNGGTVRVDIDGEEYGTFNAEGSGSTVSISIPSGSLYELTYSSGLYEGENTYDFNDPLGATEFSDGPNPSVGMVHSGTATCPFSNTYSGNLTVERYLGVSGDGWREISGGVSGQTLSNWQDDGLTMSGFTGSDHPSFGWVSVYTYAENNANGDKNNGWVEASNITNPIDPTAGHRVYIGAGSWTASITGPPRTGDQSFTLDYENDPGAWDQEGWNLIGNPYPCSIDWDSIPAADKVNIDDAIWVWNATAGNYGVYTGGSGGTGTNGVNADIASSQAFWVHANAAAPALTIVESDKTEADPVFVKSFTDQANLKIHLEGDANNYYDEAVVVWRDDAVDTIDQHDGYKLFSHVVEAPSISFVPDGINHVSINALDANTLHTSVPMEVLVGETGNYTLSFQNLELLDPSSCLILEDLDLDSLIDIHANPEYEFFMSMLYTGTRFVLHSGRWYNGEAWDRCDYTPELEIGGITLDIDENPSPEINVYPNPAKQILHVQLLNAGNFKVQKVEVLSIMGQTIKTWNNLRESELNIGFLSAGTYVLRITGEQGYLLRKFIKK